HLDDEEPGKADRQRAEEQERQLDRSGEGLCGTGVGARRRAIERAQDEQREQRVHELGGQALALCDLGEESLAVAEDQGEEAPEPGIGAARCDRIVWDGSHRACLLSEERCSARTAVLSTFIVVCSCLLSQFSLGACLPARLVSCQAEPAC